MDLRGCGTKHYIRTMRRGIVISVCNTDSHGRPSIVSKSLMDVYEREDRTRLKSGPELSSDGVQMKNLTVPLVDRTLKEVKAEPQEFVCDAGDGGSTGFDGNTTLKQLRKLTKKRKRNQHVENVLKDTAINEPTDDDLYMPLSKLKLKRSKTSKAKRNCKNSSLLSSPDAEFTVKEEDDSLHCCGEQDKVIHVSIGVQDDEHLECQNNTFSDDNSSMGHSEGMLPGVLASHEHEKGQHEYQNWIASELSYNHLVDADSISVLVPSGGMDDTLEAATSGCKDLQCLPPVIENGNDTEEAHSCSSSISQEINSRVCCISGCSSYANEALEQSNSFAIQISSMTTEADHQCKEESFVIVPDAECGSFPDSIITQQDGENVISTGGATPNELQPSPESLEHSMVNDLGCDVIEIELCKDEEKQTTASPIFDAEKTCLVNQSYVCSDTHSSPEQHSSPERLLSTRKAMSPSSQERLCMVMGAINLVNDAGLHTVPDCKGKFFVKQAREDTSIVRSDIHYDKPAVSEQTILQKATISPRITKRRSKIAKGNLDGPRLLRTLPNFTTGCTSVQGCSESAIAFSQSQMHDMEALAEKLMIELKSMKDIVEQKLLFEGYRNISLKNDADVVKSAINNATKVEDTVRKWLSVMSRDCNRFCKIMKMTPNNTATKDSTPREKRIKFADEAGGKLCHVKLFEATDDVKQ